MQWAQNRCNDSTALFKQLCKQENSRFSKLMFQQACNASTALKNMLNFALFILHGYRQIAALFFQDYRKSAYVPRSTLGMPIKKPFGTQFHATVVSLRSSVEAKPEAQRLVGKVKALKECC